MNSLEITVVITVNGTDCFCVRCIDRGIVKTGFHGTVSESSKNVQLLIAFVNINQDIPSDTSPFDEAMYNSFPI